MDENVGSTENLELEIAKLMRKQLNVLMSEKNLDTAINEVLKSLGEFYRADRVYIFEETDGAYANSYEWCAEGVQSRKSAYGGLKREEIGNFLETLERAENIFVTDLESIKDGNPVVYNSAKEAGISNFILAPIMMGNLLIGFIGVDNVAEEIADSAYSSLTLIGCYIGLTVKNKSEHASLLESYEKVKHANNITDKLVQLVGGGIFAYTLPERKVLILNSEAKRLFDFGENENDYDFSAVFDSKILPEDLKSMTATVSALKEVGDSCEYTFRIAKNDGGITTVKCNTKLLSFESGQRYILSAMSDVTSMNNLELRLYAERKQYRDALLGNSAFQFSLDLTEGYVKGPVVTKDGKVLLDEKVGSMHYDAFMKKLLTENRAIFEVKSTESMVLSQLRLLNLNTQGVTRYSAEVYLPGISKYYNVLILMSESIEKKGHVSANVIFFDISSVKLEDAKTRSIVNSLSSIYYSVYHFLVAENTFDIIKNQSKVDYSITENMDIDEFFKWYISEFVLSSHKAEMREFFDVNTLDRRFSETDSLSIDFRRKSVGWCRATLVVSGRRRDGGVASFILGFNVIEEQKQKELQASHEMQQQLLITKSFSRIYFASWIVDLDENRLHEVSVPEYAKPISTAGAGDVNGGFNYILSHFVAKQHVNIMRVFLNANTLGERMANREILSCEYLDINNGWCRGNFIPMGDNTNRYIYAVQEIGDEKEREDQTKMALQHAFDSAKTANQARVDFFSNMNHDIRTPMNAILGMAAIATTRLDDRERVADCLNKITISGKHLLGLINEVLDMSKLEAGNMVLQAEELSLPALVNEFLDMCKPQIESKRHELSVAIKNIAHEKVVGDGQRIQQVFMNLMSNAVNYTPDGGKIRLAVTEKPTNRPHVACYEFVFEDNGIGMSKEFQSKMFEPLTRANTAAVNEVQGIGLGMTIAQNIVHLMNGDIKVESELNKGTTVTVTVYLKTIDDVSGGGTYKFTDLPVLVIDDDAIACEATCDILTELGVESESVLSGKEAIKRATKRHKSGKGYFAILLDWKLRDSDGVSVLKELRKQLGQEVPIIIVSAYDMSGIEKQAKEAGATAFASKPLFKSRLIHLFKIVSGQYKDEDAGSDIKEIQKEDFSGKRVLLVEDNDLNTEIAGTILEMTGLAVDCAKDGREAVDIMNSAADGYYDIVFMDIQMPQMNGYEATKLIRSSEREYLKKVPIIAITANAFAEDVRRAINAGMNEHISKPLELDKLIETLRRWL